MRGAVLGLLVVACSAADVGGASYDERDAGAVDAGAVPAAPLAVLIFGQSNAGGMGVSPPAGIPTAAVPYWVWQARYGYDYVSAGLEPLGLVDPVREDVGPHHGIECSLGLALRDRGPVGIVKVAAGGSFAHEWGPDGELADELRAAISVASPLLKARLGIVRWVVVWIQGEAEATERSGGYVPEYPGRVVDAIGAAREALGEAAPAIVVRLNSGLRAAWVREVQVAQREAATVGGFVLLDTEHVALGPDAVHYDSAGLNVLGMDVARVIGSLSP